MAKKPRRIVSKRTSRVPPIRQDSYLTPLKNIKKNSIQTDGWVNLIAGFGRGQEQWDKLANSVIDYEPLTDNDVEDLCAASAIARRIVSTLPHEALREDFELKFDDDQNIKASIEEELQRFQVRDKFKEAWETARQYGGSGIVFIPSNMAALDKPMNPEKPDPTENLLMLSKYELLKQEVDSDLRSKNFGLPKFYTIQPRGGETDGGVLFRVHHSRVIRFDGAPLPRKLFIQNNYWGDSFLTDAIGAIRDYETSHHSVALVMQDFSIGTWKIKNLANMIAENGDEDVTTRMQVLNVGRSVARCNVLDFDNEEFAFAERNLTGLVDVLKALTGRLVAVADHIPHTKLLGESPSGLGATGRSEESDWYDFVSNRQESYLKPKLLLAIKILLASPKSLTKGNIPKGLEVLFKPLWQLSEKEQSEARYTQAQADQIYVETGVLDPLEIRDSRFGSGKYSTETQIDKGSPAPIPPAEQDLIAQGNPSNESNDPYEEDPDPAPFEVPEARKGQKPRRPEGQGTGD